MNNLENLRTRSPEHTTKPWRRKQQSLSKRQASKQSMHQKQQPIARVGNRILFDSHSFIWFASLQLLWIPYFKQTSCDCLLISVRSISFTIGFHHTLRLSFYFDRFTWLICWALALGLIQIKLQTTSSIKQGLKFVLLNLTHPLCFVQMPCLTHLHPALTN